MSCLYASVPNPLLMAFCGDYMSSLWRWLLSANQEDSPGSSFWQRLIKHQKISIYPQIIEVMRTFHASRLFGPTGAICKVAPRFCCFPTRDHNI